MRALIKIAVLAGLGLSLGGPALASPQPQFQLPPLTAERVREAAAGLIGRAVGVQEEARPGPVDEAPPPAMIPAPPGPPPSETWGYLVFRRPDGTPLPWQNRYPQLSVYFRAVEPSESLLGRRALARMDLTQPVLAPSVGRWGQRWGFFLEQRPASGVGGDGGLRRDPARNGVIYDPARWTYLGYLLSVDGDYHDPNTGERVGWHGVGVVRPDYRDLVDFSF